MKIFPKKKKKGYLDMDVFSGQDVVSATSAHEEVSIKSTGVWGLLGFNLLGVFHLNLWLMKAPVAFYSESLVDERAN